MARQEAWALHLDTIIEYLNMNIIIYAIVSMDDGVRYDFMYRFTGVLDFLKTLGA